MDGLRARLQKEGVSREASNLIIKSRRSSSNSDYESAWGKWAGWCAERKIDPFCSNLNQILEFFSQLFQNGLQYRTINNYRSAISAFHDHIQGKPVGEHPRICSLVAVVFNSRPPQPRYCFIWNVQAVIDFIKSEWGQNEDLSDKYLTYKLTMLLALTSASRVLGLQHLDVRFMTKGTNNYMFSFGKLHKAWRKRKSPPSLKVYSFEEDTKLCVVATLDDYLKRTKVWRGKDKSQLLLSFVKSHNPVVSSTISGWIKNVLREAGIDTKTFKGHSTRSASTSKAGLAGISGTDILEIGSWTNAPTWQRFCNRQVESSAEKYQNKVLS